MQDCATAQCRFQEAEPAFGPAFPASGAYRALLPRAPKRVKEQHRPPPRFAYSERHLQCVWADDAWRPTEFRSLDGERIRVVQPGRWNLEAGPDFLDAELTVDGNRRLRGDVELHVAPGDWLHHGHARDPRYSRIVAHVCWHAGGLPAHELPPGTVQICLASHLAAQPGFHFELIDTTAYPYAIRKVKQPPCHAVLRGWDPDARGALLHAAGAERLRRKAALMADAVAERGTRQVLYEEILTALGYKHNRNACRRLACAIPADALQTEAAGDAVTAYALLLGVAGLLPKRLDARWPAETRAFVRLLWDRWWKRASRWERHALPRDEWRLSGFRPQNHPLRRLSVAAMWWSDPDRDPVDELLAWPRTNFQTWFKALRTTVNRTGQLPFWDRRLSLRSPESEKPIAAVGKERLAAIAVNVAIPFLAALDTDVAPLLDAPAAEHDNALVRHTAFLLFGRDVNPALYRNGLAQQGLLQIFHDFCLNDRSNCSACLLVGALRDYQPTGA